MKKTAILCSALIALGCGAHAVTQNQYSLTASAVAVEDGAITYEVYSNYAVVSKANPLVGLFIKMEIKSSVNGVPVTEISDHAFKQYRKSGIKNIVIPSSVKKINGSTFSGAFQGSGVEEIVIPKNVNYIGQNAFSACSNLKSITILNPDCSIYKSENTINGSEDGWTIYGYTNSTAQVYAERYGYNFVALDAPVQTTTTTRATTTTTTTTTTTPPTTTTTTRTTTATNTESTSLPTETNTTSSVTTTVTSEPESTSTTTLTESTTTSLTSTSTTTINNSNNENVATSSDNNSPKTGDYGIPLGITAMASVAFVTAVKTRKRDK